jgi:ABC-type hemin transport system ATPase subunit
VMFKNGSVHLAGVPDQVIDAAIIEEVYECAVFVDKNPLTGKPRVSLKP